MAFRDMVKERIVEINEQPKLVPEIVTPREMILRAGEDPNVRELIVAYENDTTDVCPIDVPIRLKDGMRFETQVQSTNG